MASRYYVYDLIDPRTGEVFYVGKGKGRRFEEHAREARRGVISKKCDKIREIIAAGLKVRYRIVATYGIERLALQAESARIMSMRESLTNVAPGVPSLSVLVRRERQRRRKAQEKRLWEKLALLSLVFSIRYGTPMPNKKTVYLPGIKDLAEKVRAEKARRAFIAAPAV